MANDIQPLQDRVQIVNANGTPTTFFIRWAKQRQIDISEGITAAQAQDLINTWALARDIIAGVGLDGGGNLSADITINLEDTAVTPNTYGDASNIPQITVDQQGRITSVVDIPAAGGGGSLEIEDEGVSVETGVTKINFIGAGVTATSPAAGEVEVDIPGGGAGGTWTQVGFWDFAVSGAVANVVGDATGYSEILVDVVDVSLSVSGQRIIQVSVDGGATYFSTSGNYQDIAATGVGTNNAAIFMHNTSATAIRRASTLLSGTNLTSTSKTIYNYTRNVMQVFIGSTSPITHVRVLGSAGGNLNGGVVRILAR